jgi:hypothetical protein
MLMVSFTPGICIDALHKLIHKDDSHDILWRLIR